MHKTLLALALTSSLGACVATVGPGPGGPPPRRETVPVSRPPERAPEPRIIEGVVIDAVTRQPIDRAAIDITSPAFQGEMTANTGPDGRFRTREIPPGEFAIRCRRDGYEAINRKAMMGDGTARLEFEMTPKRR